MKKGIFYAFAALAAVVSVPSFAADSCEVSSVETADVVSAVGLDTVCDGTKVSGVYVERVVVTTEEGHAVAADDAQAVSTEGLLLDVPTTAVMWAKWVVTIGKTGEVKVETKTNSDGSTTTTTTTTTRSGLVVGR